MEENYNYLEFREKSSIEIDQIMHFLIKQGLEKDISPESVIKALLYGFSTSLANLFMHIAKNEEGYEHLIEILVRHIKTYRSLFGENMSMEELKEKFYQAKNHQ